MDNSESSYTTSSPSSSSRMNMIHNKLNDGQEIFSSSSVQEIPLNSPDEFPPMRKINNMPSESSKYTRKYDNDNDIDMDPVDDDDDDDDFEVEKEVVSDVDNNDDYDDTVFKVSGFVDDDGKDLKIDEAAIKRALCIVRPFVDLYTTPKLSENRKDAPRLMLETYNSWYKNFKASNLVEASSSAPKQTFAEKMKAGNGVSILECVVKCEKLIDIDSPSNSKDEVNNVPVKVSTPVRVQERSPMIRPQVSSIELSCNRTQTVTKELRSPHSTVATGAKHASPIINNRMQNMVEVVAEDDWWRKQEGGGRGGRGAGGGRMKEGNRGGGGGGGGGGKPRNNRTNSGKSSPPSQAEDKLQCPICQLEFPRSIVESHAGACQTFPMSTRSNYQAASDFDIDASSSTTRTNCTVDLTDDSWQKVPYKNKRRGGRDEDDGFPLEDQKGTDIIPVKRACYEKK